MLMLGFIATLAGLTTSNQIGVETYENNVDKLIEFSINSFMGFMVTNIFDVMAREAIKRNCRYWIKAMFYWPPLKQGL